LGKITVQRVEPGGVVQLTGTGGKLEPKRDALHPGPKAARTEIRRDANLKVKLKQTAKSQDKTSQQ
jgi:hypothetical protein